MAAGVAEFRRENNENYYSAIPELSMRVKHQCLKSVEVMINF
jgi:hypothetical protein